MGQAKICVKCPTEGELYDIQAKAQAAGLVNYLVVRTYIGVLFFALFFVPNICSEKMCQNDPKEARHTVFLKFKYRSRGVPNWFGSESRR